MTRRAVGVLGVLAVALGAPAALRAQGAPGAHPAFGRAAVHYGKWLVAGSAAAFAVMAAHEHDNSNREFTQLLSMCRANNADCALGPDGRYLNAAAEALYQSSIDFDRRARVRLLAGQVGVLVAAALFIADLTHQAGGPDNKPFSPLEVSRDVRTGRALVGLRLAWIRVSPP